MFTSLPWGLNAVLFPIMLISSCAIIFIIFLFITKPQFKLSLFHLFTIELGQPARVPPRIENRNESNGRGVIYVGNRRVIRHRRNGNNTREVGLSTNHRTLVEDISNDNSSSHSNNNQRAIQEGNDVHESENFQKTTDAPNEAISGDSTSVTSVSSTDSFVEI